MVEFDKAKLDKKLIQRILRFLENTDEDEKHFAFELVNNEIKEHIKLLEKRRQFETWLNNKELKKKAKQIRKEDFQKPVFSIMDVDIDSIIDGDSYYLSAKLAGPIQIYAESIIKKKIKKFVNISRLIFLRVIKNKNSDNEEVLVDLGHEHLGQENTLMESQKIN